MSTVNLNGQRLINVATPSIGSDGANKDYVDSMTSAGISGGGGSATPTYIGVGATYTVTANTQVSFSEPIEMDSYAELQCDGVLVEVA